MIKHFINGEFIDSQTSLPVYNPATAVLIDEVAYGQKQEVEQAIDAAEHAFSTWSTLSLTKRMKVLFRYKELIEKYQQDIAEKVSQEHGKLFNDAMGSVARAIEALEFSCGAAHLLKSEFSENVGTDVDVHALRKPLGVCLGITPFNFPVMVPNWMFPMAIACGNTFVLKPSEQVPNSTSFLMELLQQAGLPAGVVNLVHGDAETVKYLLADERIKAVSFVGSTPVAKTVYQQAMIHGKRARAFGGAKNHLMVMPDADLDLTSDAIIGAAFGSAGERCMAISVVLAVGEDTADKLAEKIKAKTLSLRLGQGKDDADIGPLISAAHLDRVESMIEKGIAAGAKLVVDGRKKTKPDAGYFLGGCFFDRVTAEMEIYQQEIFGPVLCMVRVASFEEGLKLINDHPYGNGTSLFTRSGYFAREFSSQVDVGMVGINVPIPVPMAYYSFGGWKASRFGVHHINGMDDIRFYTKLKNITTRWPQESDGVNFAMPIMQ